MLIDFFEEYTKEFDEYIASNSIAPLIKILGKKEFKHLLKIINKFNEESFNSDLRYATSIIKTTDKYQKRAKTREKVRKIFK